MPPSPSPEFRLTPLTDFQRLPRNPKDHDLGLLHESIDRFGFLEPVLVNTTTGHIVGGHGRTDVLQQKKAMNAKRAPRGITVDGGEWMVPTYYVAVDPDEEEALAIALNETTIKGGYHQGLLVDILSDLAARGEPALAGTGYDVDDVDHLIANMARAAEGITPYTPDNPADADTAFLGGLTGDGDDAAGDSYNPDLDDGAGDTGAGSDSEYVKLHFLLLPHQRKAVVDKLNDVKTANGYETAGQALCKLLEVPVV